MDAPLIIDPKFVKLLLWQNTYPQSQEIYYTLKIGKQRFVSSVRQDKKGTTYWRFRDWKKITKPEVKEEAAEATPATADYNNHVQTT